MKRLLILAVLSYPPSVKAVDQSPWLEDIDGFGFSLTNVSTLQVTAGFELLDGSYTYFNSPSGHYPALFTPQYHNGLEDVCYIGDQRWGAMSFRVGGLSASNSNSRITIGFVDSQGEETNMYAFRERSISVGNNNEGFGDIFQYNRTGTNMNTVWGDSYGETIVQGTSVVLKVGPNSLTVTSNTVTIGTDFYAQTFTGVGFHCTSGNINDDGSGNIGNVNFSSDSEVTGVETLTAHQWIRIGSTTFSTGSGSPNSIVFGLVGDIYINTNGSAGTVFYVKESTNSNGWVAK